jgi:hypothetical protein
MQGNRSEDKMEKATIGDRANAARWVSLVLGCWLLVSAFLWPHARSAQTDTWLTGMLIASFAALALALPAARRVNTLLAAWLVVSTLVLAHTDTPTLINNGLIAIAVFGLSLIAPMSLGQLPQTHQYGIW